MNRITRILLTVAVLAQPALAHSLDLTGPWRMQPGDDASWARPEFDDRAWREVRVPLGVRNQMPERFWLRRTVTAPEAELALTIGAAGEMVEVFVNGVAVGGSGPFDRNRAKLARPWTLDLPAVREGSRLVVAIRVWRVPSNNLWQVRDEGPWLLTDRVGAHLSAGLDRINRHRMARAWHLPLGLLTLAVGLILFVVWWAERARREFFWLALYLVFLGWGKIELINGASPEAEPFRWESTIRAFGWGPGPAALWAAFLAQVADIRWLKRALWPFAGLAIVLGLVDQSMRWPTWVLQAATLAALLEAIWRGPRTGSHWILWVGILAVWFTHGIAWGGWGLPRAWNQLPGSTQGLVAAAFALMYTAMKVRTIAAERGRLAMEFEAARALQQFLLSDATLAGNGREAAAAYLPAQEVGGDFYQWAALEGGGMLVATGDVSGKGLRAAMAVAMLCGAFRNRRSDAPGEVLAELNRSMAGALDGGFVTALVLRCEADGRVHAASAGHPAPWVGGRETALSPGLPLGVVKGAEYEESLVEVGPGEALTLVTDGVIEAAAASGELFGFERTAALAGRPAREIAEAAEAWGQNDDITVVTVRRTN